MREWILSGGEKSRKICAFRFNLNRLTMLYCGFVPASPSVTEYYFPPRSLYPLSVCILWGLTAKASAAQFKCSPISSPFFPRRLFLRIIFRPLRMHFSFALALVCLAFFLLLAAKNPVTYLVGLQHAIKTSWISYRRSEQLKACCHVKASATNGHHVILSLNNKLHARLLHN